MQPQLYFIVMEKVKRSILSHQIKYVKHIIYSTILFSYIKNIIHQFISYFWFTHTQGGRT